MMSPFKLAIIAFAVMYCLPVSTSAQWPNSAAENLLICNHNGEQTLPKTAATSDGGCYVCWYDHGSGNYDVYLQRLNGDGVPQWGANGLLLSNHAQESWITDYDMTVDADDFAIVAVNDIRAGGDRDIYAYRISPAGEFAWGPDGLTISDNGDFEPDPRVVVTTSGCIVIAWQQETDAGNVINVRKVSPVGTDIWSPAVITLTSANGLSIPRLAPAENDNVILQYLVHQGPQFWDPKHIYAQKYDSSGAPLWNDDGVAISTAGGLGPQMKPDLVADGAGGAFSYWYDSHQANQLHAYLQHALADGTVLWGNGVQVSDDLNQIQMSPSIVLMPTVDLVALFYQTANPDQSQWGVGAQAITVNGFRAWGNDGISLVPLGQQQRFHITGMPQLAAACVVYLEFVAGSALNTLVKAIRVDHNGEIVWPESPRTLCSVVSEKGRLSASVSAAGQVIAAWPDHRTDAGDIYLQNVNPDGSLGSLSQQPPSPFSLIEPANQDTAGDFTVTFTWHSSIDPNGGETVTYDLVLHAWYPDHWVRVAGLADTSHDLTWFDITGEPEHDWVNVDWWVEALSAGDTTHSTETWHFVIPQEGIANEPGGSVRAFALYPAYPNPFNAATTLTFDVPVPGAVTFTLYNLAGQQVTKLAYEALSAGHHSIRLDSANLTSGVYLVEFQGLQFTAWQKLVLLR